MTKRLVLVPMDGSELSRQILPEIIKFLDPASSELVLLRIAHPPAGQVGRPSRPASADVSTPMYESSQDVEYHTHPIYASQEWESLSALIEDELQTEATRMRAIGFTVQTAIQFGNPAEKIVEYIEDKKIELVAMATHARSGLSRMVLGSVAEHILRSVPVPVMMLHATENASATLAEAHLPAEALAGARPPQG